MSDLELALVAAIRDARDGDDGPRRVYADWLLERGDPRGVYLALALAPGAPEPPSPEWEDALLPAALDAAEAWESRFGAGFSVYADDLARGLPSRLLFDGRLRDLVARAPALVPLTAQDLEIDTDDTSVLVRCDWRVLADMTRSDWHGALAVEETARVRVRLLPSLDVLAERAHRYRRFPTHAGEPRELRFARGADELCYRVDDNAEVLPFAPPAAAPGP